MNPRLMPTCADQHPRAKSEADRHDPPGLIDELVPSRAAMVDAVLVRRKDPVGEPVVAHCQTFSTGFNSGARGGSGRSVMLAGMLTLNRFAGAHRGVCAFDVGGGPGTSEKSRIRPCSLIRTSMPSTSRCRTP